MFLFIIGRDKELGKLEAVRVLNKYGINYTYAEFNNDLIVNFEDSFEVKTLQDKLAGTTRIIELFEYSDEKLNEIIIDVSFSLPNSFSYTVIDKVGIKDLEDKIKSKFKQYKFKSKLKKNIDLQSPFEFYKHSFDKGLEFTTWYIEDKYYFGLTRSCTNPYTYIELDEKRPMRMFTHGTSPRLARIMVNLLNLDDNSTVVDPFCGTGTFLTELGIQSYNSIGIELEDELIEYANENASWSKSTFKYKTTTKLINGDSTKEDFAAEACVFEPFMGPFLKTNPSVEEALEIVHDLEDLYSNLFSNLNNNLTGNKQIVCILPSFITKNGRLVGINDRVFLDNNFDFQKLELNLDNPIKYSTPSGSTIQRSVYLLEQK